jgi:hypothetical protein
VQNVNLICAAAGAPERVEDRFESTACVRSGAQVGFRIPLHNYHLAGTSVANAADMVFRFRNGVWAPRVRFH